MPRVLITGSAGFIGSHLKRKLVQKGAEVADFDATLEQDLRDVDAVNQAVEGKDAVFHLAAVADLNWARLHPIETLRINVEGTWNVANACWKAGAVLYYASTCCVFGNQPKHPATEESLPRPAEIYACSKLAGESVIEGFHHTYGLQYNHMRFATIYGEGVRPALATHIFLRQALRGEPITVHGDGRQTRTLTYVEDLVDAIIALFDSRCANGKWNLSTEEEVSALKMAEDIRGMTGSRSEIVFIPQRVGQTFRESISARKMWQETGWRAKTAWIDGIERTCRWFKQTHEVSGDEYQADSPPSPTELRVRG